MSNEDLEFIGYSRKLLRELESIKAIVQEMVDEADRTIALEKLDNLISDTKADIGDYN